MQRRGISFVNLTQCSPFYLCLFNIGAHPFTVLLYCVIGSDNNICIKCSQGISHIDLFYLYQHVNLCFDQTSRPEVPTWIETPDLVQAPAICLFSPNSQTRTFLSRFTMKRSSVQPSVRRAKMSGHISAFSVSRGTEMRISQMCVETQIEGGKETVPIRNNHNSEHRRTQYSSSKHSILRKSPITCVDKKESVPMMREACTPPKFMSQSCCARNCPDIFASTSLEPLVSAESLRELELRQISKDLLLRHDLNFDRNITYRPNTHGARGQQRAVQSVEYWNAIRKELGLLLSNDYTSSSIKPSHNTVSSTQACSSCAPGLPRLSRMFGTVRMLLKSFIHEDEWDAIDARLDVDLLIQQLNNRAFDLVAFSDWLAVLLRRFCSCKRYQSIDVMTSSIKLGVERVEAPLIATGLISMFDIFETIKLVSEPLKLQTSRNWLIAFRRMLQTMKLNISILSCWTAPSLLSRVTFLIG